jgi:NADPH2:quinone reductase
MSEVPKPTLRARDVMVRVLASTINIDDIHIAEGTFYGGIPIGKRPRPSSPVTPGGDLAGVVTAIGKKVCSVHVGEAVFASSRPFEQKGLGQNSVLLTSAG